MYQTSRKHSVVWGEGPDQVSDHKDEKRHVGEKFWRRF
jgi:hypothetical protein